VISDILEIVIGKLNRNDSVNGHDFTGQINLTGHGLRLDDGNHRRFVDDLMNFNTGQKIQGRCQLGRLSGPAPDDYSGNWHMNPFMEINSVYGSLPGLQRGAGRFYAGGATIFRPLPDNSLLI
jgi:hypothetical protein